MKKTTTKRIDVLDTNVLLHDYNSIYKFDDHDVVIPITALEELDKFKKGNEMINFMAREVARELDKLSKQDLFTKGILLGKDKGHLFIETVKDFSETGKKSFPENIPDHRILAIAEYTKLQHPEALVTLVTKDINLRLKAKALGINSEDYSSDKVVDITKKIDQTIRTYPNVDNDLIQQLYKTKEGVPIEKFSFLESLSAHDYFILKNDNSSILTHYNPITQMMEHVEKHYAYNIEPRNAEQTFAMDALLRDEIPLISITGKAGTGKTLLALAAALEQRTKFDQILLARPIVPLSNKDIGYLPGQIKEKIGPYMEPLFDNLSVIKNRSNVNSKNQQRIDQMLKDEKLLITPLSYIRGRSLSNVFFIIDEAQNLTPHEIKTIITRAGENTKLVFTGDIEQIDSPYLDLSSNGLSYLTDKMHNQEVFAHINLVKGERSALAELASKLL
jgi:PhoH-like ATPase